MGAWAITFSTAEVGNALSRNIHLTSSFAVTILDTTPPPPILRHNVHHHRPLKSTAPSNLRPNHHHKTQTLPPPLHHSRQHSRRRRNRHNLPSRIRQNPHPTQLPPLRRPKTPFPTLRSPMVRRLHHLNHRQQHQSRCPLRRLRSI